MLLAIAGAGAAEVNQGYPTGIVPLKPGLLLCTSVTGVEQAFESWRRSYEQHEPERLAVGCARIPAGYSASVEYLRPFHNQHWDADLLKFYVLRAAAPGILIFDAVYYGYGSAKPRQNMLPTLEPPLYQ